MRRTPEQIRAIIKEKVTGKVTSQHNDKGHYYQVEGGLGLTASVTSKNIIEKPHLIPWSIGLAIDFLEIPGNFERLQGPERDAIIKAAKLQYIDMRDSAGTIGGFSHKALEDWELSWITTGMKPNSILDFIPNGSSPQVIAACRSAERVFDKYNVIPIAFELLVGLPGIGAGTLDLIVMNEKGKLELWDWKTSNSINDYYAIQTAAYCQFFERMTGLKIDKIKVIKIDKFSDKFKVYLVPNRKTAYKAFKAVSFVYDWLNDQEPKLLEDKTIVRI